MYTAIAAHGSTSLAIGRVDIRFFFLLLCLLRPPWGGGRRLSVPGLLDGVFESQRYNILFPTSQTPWYVILGGALPDCCTRYIIFPRLFSLGRQKPTGCFQPIHLGSISSMDYMRSKTLKREIEVLKNDILGIVFPDGNWWKTPGEPRFSRRSPQVVCESHVMP